MLFFVWPTLSKSFTLMALGLCAMIILTPTDHRSAVLTFAAGTGLGYFLERWGTTRECWTYYTRETPPLFAVLAHGMAAVAFWRAGLLLKTLQRIVRVRLNKAPSGMQSQVMPLRNVRARMSVTTCESATAEKGAEHSF
jgi:hypothetical protein